MEPTLWGLLSQAAHDDPSRIALSEAATGRTVSWSSLADLVDRVSASMIHLGLRRGDRVVIALPNRIELVAAYFGVIRAGLVAVPMNPLATTGEFLTIMGDSAARAVIIDVVGLASARAAVEGMRSVLDSRAPGTASAVDLILVEEARQSDEVGWSEMVSAPSADPLIREVAIPESDPADLAVLLYSGTSSHPRGVMLTQNALLANLRQVAALDVPMIRGTDVVLAVLPLFRLYGLNVVLGQSVAAHARIVLVDGFDPEDCLDIVDDEAVSVIPASPPVAARWVHIEDLADRLSAVRLMMTGSAQIAPELLEDFVARTSIPLHQGYGRSETGPVIATTLASSTTAHGANGGVPNGSVGAPIPGVEVRIAPSSEDTAAEGALHQGEVLVRGPNLFSGYWPDGHGGPGQDGWYATGDVGYLDEVGDLYLVGRMEELIVVGGTNVVPAEVEDVIGGLPDVAAVSVVGMPDAAMGEAVAAWIKPAPQADRGRLVEDALAACRLHLADHQVPKVVHLVDQLPHSSTGTA